MKSLFFSIIISLVVTTTANAGMKQVASCGNHKLLQGTESGYFAGILHQGNTYLLEIKDGPRLPLQIRTNSEGAELNGEYVVEYSSKDGTPVNTEKININAMWGKFNLTISDDKGKNNTVKCSREK